MRQSILLWIITISVAITPVLAHSGEDEASHHVGEETVTGSLIHYGPVQFPVWTYYLEIVLHLVVLVIAASAVFYIGNRSRAKKPGRPLFRYAAWGFSLIAIGELLTTLHHFQVHPFGIFNAVANHMVLLLGLAILAYAFVAHLRREKMKKSTISLIAIMAVTLILASCTASGGGVPTKAPETFKAPTKAPETFNDDADVKEFEIEAYQWGFNPSVIEVDQGDNVRIVAWSKDVPHSLTISEYGINLYLDGASEKTAEFVADKTGTFTMYCAVPCGRGHGSMKGTLIVR